MNKIIRLAVIMLILAAVILPAIPVYADEPAPDSPPTITTMAVYRELAEPGDMLYIWEANIPYATPPPYRESDIYLWQLIDTDGVTVLGTAAGYSYQAQGFGYNVFSIYFPAASAPTWNPGVPYILRLIGNAGVFDTPPVYNYSVIAGYYTGETAHAENQAALANKILNLAFDLNDRWMLAPLDILTYEMETETVLSLMGEDFFRGAVRGIQTFAPAVFRYVVTDLNVTARSWNDSFATGLSNQYAGTWVETAQNASRDLLGTTYDLTSIIILAILCVVLVFVNLSLTNDHWNGLIDVLFLLTIGARLGAYSLTYLGLVCAVAIIFIGTKVWRMIPT